MSDEVLLTVGCAEDGRKIAIITRGGHPQRTMNKTCEVLAVEVVDGWGRKKIEGWFDRQVRERPWETRQ